MPSHEVGHFFGISQSLRACTGIGIAAIHNDGLSHTASKMQPIEEHGRGGEAIGGKEARDRTWLG